MEFAGWSLTLSVLGLPFVLDWLGLRGGFWAVAPGLSVVLAVIGLRWVRRGQRERGLNPPVPLLGAGDKELEEIARVHAERSARQPGSAAAAVSLVVSANGEVSPTNDEASSRRGMFADQTRPPNSSVDTDSVGPARP